MAVDPTVVDRDQEVEVDLLEVDVTSDKEEIERCIMLCVVTAEKTAKFHSSQQEASQYYAVTVLQKIETLNHVDLAIAVVIEHQDVTLHQEMAEAHRTASS